jgi:hypothetical protein
MPPPAAALWLRGRRRERIPHAQGLVCVVGSAGAGVRERQSHEPGMRYGRVGAGAELRGREQLHCDCVWVFV